MQEDKDVRARCLPMCKIRPPGLGQSSLLSYSHQATGACADKPSQQARPQGQMPEAVISTAAPDPHGVHANIFRCFRLTDSFLGCVHLTDETIEPVSILL